MYRRPEPESPWITPIIDYPINPNPPPPPNPIEIEMEVFSITSQKY